MKTIRCAGFLFVVVLYAATVARSQTRVPDDDTQSWTDVQLTVPLTKQVDFLIQGTIRLGDNLTQPVDGRWGAGFNYKIGKYLTLHELYFHRLAKPPNGRLEREDRLTLGASVRKPFRRFALSDRNWFEHRWRSPQVDAWRYRNRILFEYPFTINKVKLTGLVSEEVFYDWSLRDWVRNRFGVGISHAYNKHVTVDLYLMRQNDGRSRPGDIWVLGSQLRFKL